MGPEAAAGPRRGLAPLLPKQLQLVRTRRAPLLGPDGQPVLDKDGHVAEWRHAILIYRGGWRSGKTTALCAKAIDNGRRHYPWPVLAIEPTFPMIRAVFVDAMRSLCDRWKIHCHWQEGKKILTVGRRYPVTIWCRSADSRKSIEGITAGSMVGDEWELWDPEILTTAMARVSAGPEESQQIVLGGTPEGFGAGWELLEKDPAPSTTIIVSKSSENFTVRRSYVADMRGRMSEEDAAEKLDGERTAPAGRVYTRFDRAVNCGPPCVRAHEGTIEAWCDFNEGKMAWAFVRVSDDRRRFHVFGELVVTHTDSQKHAARAMRWLEDWFESNGTRMRQAQLIAMRINAVLDASGDEASAITPLTHVVNVKEAGFVPLYGAENPRVEDRVASVQKVLGEGRLTFDSKLAPYVTRCIEQQPKLKDGSPNKDHDLGLDHGSDCVGYGVMWHCPGFKPAPAYVEAARAKRWAETKKRGSARAS